MTRKSTFVAIAILAVAIGGVAGLNTVYQGKKSAVALAPVVLQLDWAHGPDFAGYYAADQNGDFAAQGLAVSFLTGGPEADPAVSVIEGEAEFATATAHYLIKQRAQGKPVRAIACIYRRAPLVFASLAKSGIAHPSDFEGKTIRLAKQNLPVLVAMMNRVGIDPAGYTVVQTRDLGKLHSGEVDIWGGYLTGSVRQLRNAGYRVNVVHPDNHGVHSYHECLFTTDRFIESDPELVTKFLGATLSGWRYTANDFIKAGSMVAEYQPDADPADSIESVRESRVLFNAGEDRIGWMKPKIWSDMAAMLHDMEVLAKPFDAAEVYTLRFLKAIYDQGG